LGPYFAQNFASKFGQGLTMTSTATGDSKSMYMRDDVKEYGYLGLHVYSGS